MNINRNNIDMNYIIRNKSKDYSSDCIIDYIGDFSAPHYGVAEVLYGSIGCKGTPALLFYVG